MISMNKLSFFFVTFLLAANTFAMPSSIVLIRHGEKPTTGPEGQELSKKGWQRAKKLPELFLKNSDLKLRGVPDFLIAIKPNSGTGSIRSIQTLQPISLWLKKPIQADFNKDEINELVQFIMHSPEMNDQVILIAWQHDSIPELAKKLGATNAPSEWPSKVFDRFWLFDYKNDHLVNFQNLPQHLLDTDSSK